MADPQLLRAYLRLHLAEGVGAVSFRRLTEAFGDVVSAAGAGPARWRGIEGLGPKKVQALAEVTEEFIEEELAVAQKHGVSIVCQEDAAYPAALRTIYDPPAVLYVRGQLQDTDAVAMAVVGSRRCTHYGMEQAGRFGQLLGGAGFTVVSGGARGIDTAAHRGALAASGRTIAVMGCGLAMVYPPENEPLFEQIVAGNSGAVLSEIPMRRKIESRNFPNRNRIISGLSLGVLVVEAAQRSGALLTAREAAEQGREVFAVPGRADSPMSVGTNRLIRDGAILVQGLEDILEHLGEVGDNMKVEEPARPALPQNLDEAETKIVDVLSEGALGLDEVVRRTGVEIGQASARMTMLVLKGVVAQLPGNVFSLKRRKLP